MQSFDRRFKPYLMKGKPTYYRGDLPCGSCSSGRHKNCRVRLDDSLCTCRCTNAAHLREQIEMLVVSYRARGENPPTNQEASVILGLKAAKAYRK